jgi:hypothetical protein
MAFPARSWRQLVDALRLLLDESRQVICKHWLLHSNTVHVCFSLWCSGAHCNLMASQRTAAYSAQKLKCK